MPRARICDVRTANLHRDRLRRRLGRGLSLCARFLGFLYPSFTDVGNGFGGYLSELAILGASILGIGGDEVIHGILDIMYSRQPYTTLQRSVGIHPTVSELLPTVLGELEPLT